MIEIPCVASPLDCYYKSFKEGNNDNCFRYTQYLFVKGADLLSGRALLNNLAIYNNLVPYGSTSTFCLMGMTSGMVTDQ
jgi:hypothetical protein